MLIYKCEKIILLQFIFSDLADEQLSFYLWLYFLLY
jgi:hypothetical protein